MSRTVFIRELSCGMRESTPGSCQAATRGLTSKNERARHSGPTMTGRLICEASSTSATSKVLPRDSSGWRQDRHVVATRRAPAASADSSEADE